jgi:DNA topoisomerase IB
VQERDPGILSLTGHNPHPVDHLFSVVNRLLIFGNKEREDAHVRRLHHIGGAQSSPETLQVRPERVRHGNFAYRRANRRYPETALRGRVLYPIELIVRKVEHIGVPYAAQLHVAHGLLRQCLQLLP